VERATGYEPAISAWEVDNQEVPPSVHPKRRRVRLVVVSNRDGDSGGALEFSDTPGEPITTPSGQGLLVSELFPSRDHGVIEYIQSKMEWLTEDHIITMIRLARTRLNLPIYRRGRMPKSLKKTSESKTEE